MDNNVASMVASIYLSCSSCAVQSREQARMHAFFADGVDKMHILWAIEVAETATSLAVLSL